jgi:hypothetical protein
VLSVRALVDGRLAVADLFDRLPPEVRFGY